MMTMSVSRWRVSMCGVLLAGALGGAGEAARASMHTMAECLEGSDFIANAAIARDNGMSRTAFIGKLEEDLTLIHAFPAELRWFARDADDERFLHAAAEAVFDAPRTPDVHRQTFLRACFGRIALAPTS